MMHDFSKPQPHVASTQEIARKRKLPDNKNKKEELILLALLIFMVADHSNKPTAQVIMSQLHSVLLNA